MQYKTHNIRTPGRVYLLGAFLLFGGFLIPYTIFFLSFPFSVDFCSFIIKEYVFIAYAVCPAPKGEKK